MGSAEAVDHAIGGLPPPRWLAPLGPFSPYTVAVVAAVAGVALVALGGGIRYAGTYLSGEGRAVLLDFDLARAIGEADGAGDLRGSAPYMAPEQIRRAPASRAMDLDRAITTLLAPEPSGRPETVLAAMDLLAAAMPKRERGAWPKWVRTTRSGIS